MFTVSGLDIILSLIIVFFFTLGFVYGFVHALGLIAGMVVGLWAANEYFKEVATWAIETIPFLGKFAFLSENVVQVVCFVLVGVIIFKLVALMFDGIDRLLRMLYVIPFMKSINRLLGGIIGLAEAVLMLSLIIHFITKVDFANEFAAEHIAQSTVALYLLNIGTIIAPILPNIFSSVASLFR